jgi:hypothetical protein
MLSENVVTISKSTHLRVVRCEKIHLSKEEFKQLPRNISENWHRMSESERWLAIHAPKPTAYCTPLAGAFDQNLEVFE